MRHAWSGLGSALLLLIFLTPLSAQADDLLEGTGDGIGPVGNVEDSTQDEPDPADVTPGWKDLTGYSGPLGRVDEYLPHEACEMCFTIPNYDKYSIYEYAESDMPDGAIIISREIPNPAPEVMERDDYDPEIGGYYDPETGERVWFIGTLAIVGPTDEEKWSPALPVSTIEMKRIKARHMIEIMDIEGVNAFGIGTEGFEVDLESKFKENRKLIPEKLEGIPVKVEIVDGLGAVLGNSTSRPLSDERNADLVDLIDLDIATMVLS